jgi:hypothetical protein
LITLKGYKPFKVFYFKADYLNDTLVQEAMRRPSRQRSVCPMAAGLGRSRPAPRMWMSKAKEEVKETTMNMVGKIGDGWEG